MNGQLSTVLAQANNLPDLEGGGGSGTVSIIIVLAVALVALVGMWKTFEKAGKPGWGCIIPIYNLVLLLEIAGRPLWWIVMFIIPPVGAVVYIILKLDIARNFGKSVVFGIGLVLLPFIFYPILGFGDARYRGATA